METRKTQNSQSNAEKEKWSWGKQAPDFRLYCKARVVRTVQCWHRKRNVEQWNRTGSSETNPCTCGQQIHDKQGKNTQWRKDSLFSKWCWENCTVACGRMKLEHSLTPDTKVNLKWIKDVNVRLVL